MILVLLGPPGVGKGTQGARIAEHYGLPTISTGAMFRDMAARGTPEGLACKTYLDRGEYVPDDVVVAAVRARIAEPDCKAGFLLDGFPRTGAQAEALDAMLAESGRAICLALDFEAPIAALVKRFSGRRVCPVDGTTYHVESQPPKREGICDVCGAQLVTRPDDKPEVVQHRLEIYAEKTAPLLGYYRDRGLLYCVDGTGNPCAVFGESVELLNRVCPTPAAAGAAA
jgi:adenylate kinase